MPGPLAEAVDVVAAEKVGQPSPGPRGPIGRRTRSAGGCAVTECQRLPALRTAHAGAESANSAKRLGGVVTSGGYRRYCVNGTGTESAREAGVPDAAAVYRRAANPALVAPAALDLDHGRAEVPAAVAAEACAAPRAAIAPERHRKAMAGLLRGFAAHSRPSGEGAPS